MENEDFIRTINKEIKVCYYGLVNGEPNTEIIEWFAADFIKEITKEENNSLVIEFEGCYKGQSDYSISLEVGDWLAYNGYCFYPTKL